MPVQDNIMVDDDRHVKIADFGLTILEDATLESDRKSSSQKSGTIRWMAPELLRPEDFAQEFRCHTVASDIYAFACVCLEVCTTFNVHVRVWPLTGDFLEALFWCASVC